jgi:phage baseplate assembly protein V
MKFSRDYVGTSGVGDYETTDLDRRAQDGSRLGGKVKEVDYNREPPAYRIEIGDPNDEDNYILTDWLPAGGGRAKGDVDTHYLEVGEKVAIIAEGGELSTGHVVPAGVYTKKNDDEKPGTKKAGVWHKRFKNGQEMSLDRETGALLFNCEGQKKDEGNSNARAAGGEQKIAGSATIKAGGGTFVMKDGAMTVTFGGTTFKFSEAGFEQTGGAQKHDGKNVGKDHRHTEVESGPSKSGPPE